jgi:2-(1,2-epoxy-1,2-dihydrophenyl)acetyl-CoA isomerase
MRTIKAYEDIHVNKDTGTGIVTVTINRPELKNALRIQTFEELFKAVDDLEKDDGSLAMVITGAKKPVGNDPQKEAFSSGGFMPKSKPAPDYKKADNLETVQDIAQKKLAIKMFSCEKPIIAAINGLAVGAGFTMPLCGADLIFMSEFAWITMPFNRIGIIAEFACSFLLPRTLGFQKTKEILFFGKRLTAVEAKNLGLVNDVLPHDELLTYTREKVMELIPPGGPGLAIKTMKRTIHKPYIDALAKSLDLENEGLALCVKTFDFKETLAARRENRLPSFQGA